MDDPNNDISKNDAGLNASTRRIPKSLIEEQIRKEKEKKQNGSDTGKFHPPTEEQLKETKQESLNKTTVINREDLNKTTVINSEDLNKTTVINREDLNTTQNISLDETITIKKPEDSTFLKQPQENISNKTEMRFPRPQKKANPTPWIIMMSIIVIAAVIFSVIGNKEDIKDNESNNMVNKSEKVIEEVVTEKKVVQNDDVNINDGEDKNGKKIKPDLLDKVGIVETINLSNENLSGESINKIRKKGALLSEENDPKVVAIVNALIKRLEIVKGVRTTKKRGVISKRWRGIYRGFKIDAQKKEKKGKVILNKVFVTTPSKGQISANNGVLTLVKNLKFDTFINDLGKKGVSVIENDQDNNANISLNLKVLPSEKVLSKNDFLISASGVFGIKGGDDIADIGMHLPKGFRVIKKTIDIDENISYNIHKVHNKEFHPLFFVKEWGDRIKKIEITSKRFKTKEGIGINSSLGLLRIYYPDLKIAKTKGNLIIVFHEEIGGYFIVDSTVEDFKVLNFKDSAKIIKIVLE